MHIYLCDKKEIEDGEEAVRRVCKAYAEETGAELSVQRRLETAVISRQSKGKPHFRDIPQIHFSISHSGSVWGCAVDSCPLGFDLEDLGRFENSEEKMGAGEKDRRWLGLARRYFTDVEYEYVRQGGKQAFFRLWVRKEAYLKYRGEGLALGLGSIELMSEGGLISRLPDAWIQGIPMDPGLEAAYCAGEKRIVEIVAGIGDFGSKGDAQIW